MRLTKVWKRGEIDKHNCVKSDTEGDWEMGQAKFSTHSYVALTNKVSRWGPTKEKNSTGTK